MGTERDLVRVAARLREMGVNLFSDKPDGEAASQLASVSRQLSSAGFDSAEEVANLCLRALQVQHSILAPHLLDIELVATLPQGFPGVARPTRMVIREMLARASKEVIVLGYAVQDDTFLSLLQGASGRGADVQVICDRAQGGIAEVLKDWPASLPAPRIFCDIPVEGGAPHASMHAKSLLVDGHDLLVSSANFTFHGMKGNIEVGVRVQGAISREARKVFSHLVESGLVEELTGAG